ncbi:Branched-chain amino acid transport ATP-binding protein LivF (TC 3.A.1.4.1) [hydrothermal vent metagenome]|uniref:Branched-chain amino acid transport ATP-binding protein LivF (TC 3.A.1.4.1) n=1 Tax=hydrothermal vent metagenome TaxID=652676 RepID=A0A3B0SGB8_9ZZZZ
MLKINNLRSGYGRSIVLRDIDLTLDDGEIVAVLGRNGAGKTTLMQTLSGAIKVWSGQIELNGKDITALPMDRRAKLGVGYVPQGRGIFTKLTVLENLRVGLYATGGDKSIVEETIEEFPALRNKLSDVGGDLSGGQQQILALARALIIKPKLLLLDEPSEGIQPSILDEISDVLCRLRKEKGISILVVEQNIDFIKLMADRAYLMDIGSISREITCDQLDSDEELHRDFLGGISLEEDET